MLAWIIENAATLIISAIILAVVVLNIVKLVKDKRQGKLGCGSCCDGCPSNSICKPK